MPANCNFSVGVHDPSAACFTCFMFLSVEGPTLETLDFSFSLSILYISICKYLHRRIYNGDKPYDFVFYPRICRTSLSVNKECRSRIIFAALFIIIWREFIRIWWLLSPQIAQAYSRTGNTIVVTYNLLILRSSRYFIIFGRSRRC